MKDDMRRFMARTSPKSMKSVVDLAKYGTLPNLLTVGEVAQLWSKEGMEKKTAGWSEIVDFLIESIKSGALACNNRGVAFGGVNKSWAEYEAIASRFGYQSRNDCADKYYKPEDTKIDCDNMKRFLDDNGGLHLVKDFLISRWLCVTPGNEELAINPSHTRSPARLSKDRDAIELLKIKPSLSSCVEKKILKNELQSYSVEFKRGFDDWWKTQNIFEKRDAGGRPPKGH